MSKGRNKKIVDDLFWAEVKKLTSRPLTAKEKQDLARSAKIFVRDNFAVTSVYDSETIEEACSMMKEGDEEEAASWVEEELNDFDVIIDDYSGRRADENE